MLCGSKFLPTSSLLTLRRVDQNDSGWTVEADGPDRAACPRCRRVSRSRHSNYWRTLKDLPFLGATVTLKVRVGRWRCRNRSCANTFLGTELPGVTTAYSRQTSRARAIVSVVGHALGGRPAETLHEPAGCADQGFIAKIRSSRRKGERGGLPWGSELGGERRTAQAMKELGDRIRLCHPSHSALPNHVHRFDSLQGSPRGLKGAVAFRQPDSFLHGAMVLFDHIVEILACAVKRRWSTAGKVPPGNWFAPPGSNRSSSGGNEAAEASGVEGRFRRLGKYAGRNESER